MFAPLPPSSNVTGVSCSARRSHHTLPGRNAAREHDTIHARVAGQGTTDRSTRAGDDLEHRCWQADLQPPRSPGPMQGGTTVSMKRASLGRCAQSRAQVRLIEAPAGAGSSTG